MTDDADTTFTAFHGRALIASGPIGGVAVAARAAQARDGEALIHIFEDTTGRATDVDLRGSDDDIRRRLAPPEAQARGPGRPKLGVVAREITLLPRHWDWLASQPGGASVTLRKLVEAARRAGEGPNRRRRSRDAAYRFMSAMAGDEPGFEEAIRALYANDGDRFARLIEPWPTDVRDHAQRMAADAFAPA